MDNIGEILLEAIKIGLAGILREALIKSPLRKSDPVSTIEIHLPLKSKSFLRHPSNLKFGQDFQLRLNQRFLRETLNKAKFLDFYFC
jgi:hypothetical protein